MKKMLIGILLLAGTVQAREVKVMGVTDGDTILVYDGEVREINIAGIDAPELSQPYGMEAARLLDELLPTTVYLSRERTVQGGRRVAEVSTHYGARSIAWDLVEQGAAWCDHPFNRDNPADTFFPLRNEPLCKVENSARVKTEGLWARPAVFPKNWGTPEKTALDMSAAAERDRERRMAAREAAALAHKKKVAEDLAMAQLEASDPEAAALLRIEKQNKKILKGLRRARIQNIQSNATLQNQMRQIEWNQNQAKFRAILRGDYP